MKSGLKISVFFLFLMIFITYASAYDSFSVLKENTKSSDMAIIHSVNSAEVKEKDITIVRLKTTEGDFADLIEYINQSNIKRVIFYIQDDINHIELGGLIGQELGIKVDIMLNEEDRDGNLVTKKNTLVTIEPGEVEEVILEEENETPETNTPSIGLDIPKINTTESSITGNIIKEQDSETNNSSLLMGLIIGIAIILGFIIQSLILKKNNSKEK